MFDDIYLSGQKEILLDFMHSKYNIVITKSDNIDNFINPILGELVSIKIWSQYLNVGSSFGANQYLDEIISNFNQLILLAMLGFEIPSYMLIRRSLENLLMFLYFKDHPIEFMKRELAHETKGKERNQEYRVDRNRISELKEYVANFPFSILYQEKSKNKIDKLLIKIVQSWDKQYANLSNFVHGTSSRYLELNNYLDEIGSDPESLNSISDCANKFCSLVNVLLILFYFDRYKSFGTTEKSIIRNAIDGDDGFKQDLIEIFGEI